MVEFSESSDARNRHVEPPSSNEPLWYFTDVASNVSVGQWIADEVRNFDGTIGSLVPPGFPVYVRILHPAYTEDDRKVRWREAADAAGAVMHQTVEWGSIVEAGRIAERSEQTQDLWHDEPDKGQLPAPERSALAAVLSEFTTTPDDCWFGFWEGTGVVGISDDAPRLQLPGRGNLLIHGSIDDAAKSLQGFGPNLWWPSDRSWFVATDVDLMSTYVGCPTVCGNMLRADKRLEVLDTHHTRRVTWDSDTVNPLPAQPFGW